MALFFSYLKVTFDRRFSTSENYDMMAYAQWNFRRWYNGQL